jgi:hypothetical protein
MNAKTILAIGCILLSLSCDKKNDDLLTPLSSEEFPQVIVFADEGDGELEDEDKFSVNLTLLDRKDPDGEELGGKVIPLDEPVTVHFAVKEKKGLTNLTDYIKGATAFYEVDDCTTMDIDLQFDVNTGTGSVTFPADVEEIEIEFETDDALFDDDEFNDDERSITFMLTGIDGSDAKVSVNKSGSFKYNVFDDEGIYGEWELDVDDADAFAKFKELFGLINEDIRDLDADDVEEIALEFEYGEVKAIVVLKETEQVDECGDIETVNKVIEIETEIEDIDDDSEEGDVEFGEVLELDNGAFREFAYKGSFSITNGKLSITLEGEFGDNVTDEITLELEK